MGDIQHSTLAIERGAFFDGRSVRSAASNVKQAAPEKLTARLRRERELTVNGREPAAATAA